MKTRVIMVQGTGSSVGKSTLTSGLARALTRRGFRVKPFKPQNMSNNAAVTKEGGEIGRAQALQAQACHVAPSILMNPILLKPQGGGGSQVVVLGQYGATYSARGYQEEKNNYLPIVCQAFRSLCAQADIVLVEGAGAASEINLRESDIANMGFARAVNAPVILVGDIDRGGVIASIVGTQVVLNKEDSALIKAFIVNRMRGDASLFEAGNAFIAQRTKWSPLGIVPYFAPLSRLPQEDSADLHDYFKQRKSKNALTSDGGKSRNTRRKRRIIVPIYPTISNYDDLDPLFMQSDLEIMPVFAGDHFPQGDGIILLGSKSTLSDLEFLKKHKWAQPIKDHVRRGGGILGICGGYQMLGETLTDANGREGVCGTIRGLGLLKNHTELAPSKTLRKVSGCLAFAPHSSFTGYEMHIGRSFAKQSTQAFAVIDGRMEGQCTSQIMGTYVHGLFNQPAAREAILDRLCCSVSSYGQQFVPEKGSSSISYDTIVETTLEQWADHCERFIDMEKLLSLAKEPHFTV